MHQAGWLVLLTLIVWSRCDQMQIPLTSSLADGGTPYDQWVLTNRGSPGGPNGRDDDGDDGSSETALEAPVNSDDSDTDDDDGDDGDGDGGGDPFDDSDDFDGSASTASVQAVRNQSELNSSLAALLRNHNLESLKKNFDSSKPLDRQKIIVADLLKTLTSGGNLTETDSASNKVCLILILIFFLAQFLFKQNITAKSYDINDLKKYYEHIKTDENQQVSPEAQTSFDSPSNNNNYQHANHNYFSKGDWRPVISTVDHHRPSFAPYHEMPTSFRVSQYSASEIPSALANFYVDTDTHLLHAHETQQNQKQDSKDQGTPKTDQGTSSNLSGTTVKDLISTKDPVMKEKEKIASLLHKQHGGYVAVDNNSGGDKTYQDYVNCCEHLFKNYGQKEHIHEDIYLVPGKGGELELQGPPHRPPYHQIAMMPPGPYMRGFPGLDPEMKFVSGGGGGKDGPGDFGGPPGGGHVPVQCLEDQHHSGHLVPAAYHHGGRPHHPRPYHGHNHHHIPPAAFLLKKKLALIGKKYLFGAYGK